MSTAASIYWVLNELLLPVDIRNVCVFIAPLFSAFTALATYLFCKEITFKTGPGLFGAFFMAIVPSYISRSVAGI